jgi:hypothetical protein
VSKILNAEGRVFGCLSAKEQAELKDAAKVRGAIIEMMNEGGAWEYLALFNWYAHFAYRVTIPDDPPKCPKCGESLSRAALNEPWRCGGVNCVWSKPDPAQRPRMPDAREGYHATEYRVPKVGEYFFSTTPVPCVCYCAMPGCVDGPVWIAVKDAPAKPEPAVRYWRYNKNEHVYKVEDGRVVEFVPPGGKVIVGSKWAWDCDNGDDVEITAAEYEAAKQPAPKVSAVGKPVKPIEPLSLLAGTGIVEVIRKINEIIERLNGKGGV